MLFFILFYFFKKLICELKLILFKVQRIIYNSDIIASVVVFLWWLTSRSCSHTRCSLSYKVIYQKVLAPWHKRISTKICHITQICVGKCLYKCLCRFRSVICLELHFGNKLVILTTRNKSNHFGVIAEFGHYAALYIHVYSIFQTFPQIILDYNCRACYTQGTDPQWVDAIVAEIVGSLEAFYSAGLNESLSMQHLSQGLVEHFNLSLSAEGNLSDWSDLLSQLQRWEHDKILYVCFWMRKIKNKTQHAQLL